MLASILMLTIHIIGARPSVYSLKGPNQADTFKGMNEMLSQAKRLSDKTTLKVLRMRVIASLLHNDAIRQDNLN